MNLSNNYCRAVGDRPVKLSIASLEEIQRYADIPQYDIGKVRITEMHIGPSAFFRAHKALMNDDYLAQCAAEGRELEGGIVAVSLRNPDYRDKLSEQDCLYTVTSKGEEISRPRVIGSIRKIMVAREAPNDVLEMAANPDIKTISFTITQKGYYYDAKQGFNFDDPDIQACLDKDSPEMSSIGLLVSALQLRMERGIEPPLILSLDNLPGNGTILRSAVLAYASKKSETLKNWIAEKTSFPDNMVDRITPKTTDDHTRDVTSKGIIDAWPIQAEPMPKLPLVIEYTNNQPHSGIELLRATGARITNEVTGFEKLKVRTLNGVHMALGCIGHLSGYSFSHEAMADKDIRHFSTGFMNEVGKTLKPTDDFSHDDFRLDVVRRLDNPNICDQLTRLSRNGTTKVPSRFLESIRDIVSSEEMPNDYNHLAFALASWIQYAKDLDENGALPGDPPKEPNDSNAAKIGLTSIVERGMIDASSVFAVKEIFGNELSGNKELITAVNKHLSSIHQIGMKAALRAFVEEQPKSVMDLGTPNPASVVPFNKTLN